jgi:hypothetical protein
MAPPACRSALVDGFSLHADVAVAADDRPPLERLCRYGARPPFAHTRLALMPTGTASSLSLVTANGSARRRRYRSRLG